MYKKILFLIIALSSMIVMAQNTWTKTTQKSTDDVIFVKSHMPYNYDLYELDMNQLQTDLQGIEKKENTSLKKASTILSFPGEFGKMKHFKVLEDNILDSELAAKFPMIKTYVGQGIDDPTATIRISIGTDGFHAMILAAGKSSQFIDPYTRDRGTYIMYSSSNLPTLEGEFNCEFKNDEGVEEGFTNFDPQQRNADDGKLRTYDLAVACTIEYSAYHLAHQGVSTNASLAVKKAAVLSAIVNTINRVQQIYEKEIAVRFSLIPNNDLIIFIPNADGDNDPSNDDNFTNGPGGSPLINESQTEIDAIIGNANYDIGHTFSTGGGGLASLGGICSSDRKAKAITGGTDPIGDFYDIDYVAHEMGHHFGANHTYNGSGQGSCTTNNDDTAGEPGGGTTIMAYAGICGGLNVQANSDAYFHVFSLQEINDRLNNAGGFAYLPWYPQCGAEIITGNNEPTADAGYDYTIPKGTAFVLYGDGADQDGDAITFNWEQIDTDDAVHPLVSTSTQGPAYRSFFATTSPDRYMPKFETVFNGSVTSDWEMTPSVARTMNFNLTVRDNNAAGGQYALDEMMITVANAGPFVVTSQPTEEIWATGETKTITWDVAGTTANGVDEANVRIILVDNNGTELAELVPSTPNNGSFDITVPNITNNNTRVMVQAINNIFYAINSAIIAVNDTPAYCGILCPSHGGNGNDGTTKVIFNTIDNSSDTTNSYSDFRAISTDVTIGESYNLTVQVNTAGPYKEVSRAWIDWNRDCDFDDAGEQYDLGEVINTTDGATDGCPLSITVPANASVGETAMRVTSSYDVYKASCDSFQWGEVEDYTINIIAPSACNGITATWNGTTWSPNVPTSNDKAIINGAYNFANGDINSCELTINAGITITIPAGKFMLAEHDIINNGTIIVEHEGSIVQIADDATVTGNDFKIQKTTTPYVEYDYTYWSSPIENADIATVFAANTASRIYDFTTANFLDTTPVNTYDDNNDDWNVASGIMTKGKGYIVMGDAADFPFDPNNLSVGNQQNVSFNGKINNGVIMYPVTLDGGADNFTNDNLVGNPYPSAIDAGLFLAANTNLNGTIWLWSHDTQIAATGTAATDDDAYNFTNADYATWTTAGGVKAHPGDVDSVQPSGKIASGQAFFVSLKQASGNGNVTFNNAMRVTTGNDNFFRPTTPNGRIWLNMTGANGLFRQIMVGFFTDASDNEDNYDGKRMFLGTETDFYSVLNTNKYAIQGLPTFTNDRIVPLGIASSQSENFTISIDHLEGDLDNTNVYLKDNILNITHDLKIGDYTFTSQVGEDNARFELLFNRSVVGIDEIDLNNQLIISENNENELTITTSNNSIIKEVRIYDILGKLIVDKQINATLGVIKTERINNGTVLFIKTTLENNYVLNKKFIKI